MMAYEQFAAYVANLGRYNEGGMVGDWLPLPYDPDRLDGWLRDHALIGTTDAFGQPYEEYVVLDFDNMPLVGSAAGLDDLLSSEGMQYVSLPDLNLVAAACEDARLADTEAIEAYCHYCDTPSTIDEACNLLVQAGDIPFHEFCSTGATPEESMGLSYADEAGLADALEGIGLGSGLPSAASYLDYGKLGRDLMTLGYGVMEHGYIDTLAGVPSLDELSHEELLDEVGLLPDEPVAGDGGDAR